MPAETTHREDQPQRRSEKQKGESKPRGPTEPSIGDGQKKKTNQEHQEARKGPTEKAKRRDQPGEPAERSDGEERLKKQPRGPTEETDRKVQPWTPIENQMEKGQQKHQSSKLAERKKARKPREDCLTRRTIEKSNGKDQRGISQGIDILLRSGVLNEFAD